MAIPFHRETISEFWRRHGSLVKTAALALFWTWVFGVLVPQAMLLSRFRWQGVRLGGWRYGALAPLSLGTVMVYVSLWQFATFGRGTPAPFDPPKRLVVRGFYRYVRNPIYVGAFLIALSELLLVNAVSLPILAVIAAVLLVVHLLVVFYEEPVLRSQFGEEYEAYLRSVPRWMPKVF